MAKVRLKYFKISLALSVCILLGLYYNAFIESWSRTFEDDEPIPSISVPRHFTQLHKTQISSSSTLLTSTPALSEIVIDKYVQVGYYDLKGNDMGCDKHGSCHEFRVRSEVHAMMLCEIYGNACQGFVFAGKTGRLLLKANVNGETVYEPYMQFYVKKTFRRNLILIEERQCAVPIDSFQNSSDSGCVLPVLDPFDRHIMKFITKNDIQIQCPGKRYTSYKNGVLSLKDKDNYVKGIQVQAITRKHQNDWEFVFTNKPFDYPQTKSLKIDEEFLRIDISTSTGEKLVEFHAEVVPKPEVLQRQRNEKGLKVNVLMVGFDSTSSAQMQRAMPEVYKFLKNELNSYIFHGYSVVGDGTTPQLTAMLTGHTETELPEARRGYTNSTTVDSWPWIFKEYRKHGYVTMYSEDDAYYNAFNYRLHGFKNSPADHYSRPFWQAARTEGYCIKATPQAQLHFSYIESFMSAYKEIPKLGLAFLASVSHSNMNTLKPAQKFVLNFLKSIKAKGLLENTMLVVFSDHGMRFGEARVTMQSKLEERLPFLSITLPKITQKTFPEIGQYLEENTKKLTSPFDIHATLNHILSYPTGQALFTKTGRSLLQRIPDRRDCFACGIPEHYCPCVQLKEIPVTHLHVRRAAEGLLDKINGILNGEKLTAQKCATLKLGEIKSAFQNLNHPKVIRYRGSEDIDGRIPLYDGHVKDYECNYQLLIRTIPGNGLFEATVQLLDGKFYFEKEISRINGYGDQPMCIAEERPYIRKFCFCKIHERSHRIS